MSEEVSDDVELEAVGLVEGLEVDGAIDMVALAVAEVLAEALVASFEEMLK